MSNPKIIVMEPTPGDLWVWWSLEAQPPYLNPGGNCSNRPCNSIETARVQLLKRNDSVDARNLERIRVGPDDLDYWIHSKSDYLAAFKLPLDELTDQFDAENRNCHLANSLTDDLQVTVVSNTDTEEIEVSKGNSKLYCTKKSQGADASVEMHIFLAIQISRPRCSRSNSPTVLTGTVAIPSIYEGPIPLTLEEIPF